MCTHNPAATQLHELSRRNSGLLTKPEAQTLLGSGFARDGLGGPIPTILGSDPSTLRRA